MILFIIPVAIIAIDQLTKILIRTNLQLGESLPVISDYVNITYVKNTGTAFSMFQNNQIITVGLTTVLIIVCVIVACKEYKGGSKGLSVALSCIAAGGMGNMIDRLSMGYVTDMISIGNFPVFNVADIAVTCGCVAAILIVLFAPIKQRSSK